MTPSLLVLADLSALADRAAHYAALLGSPLHAHLTLLHIYQDPVLELELAGVTSAQLKRNQADTATVLRAVAQRLSVPADVTVSVASMPKAIAEAVLEYHPLLLVMGLSSEHALLDHWLHNQLLPVLRATQQPVLLVPEAAALRPPRRVVLAVDAEPFTLNTAALKVAALFSAWPEASYTVASIPARHEQPAFSGEMALDGVRTSKLLPQATPLELYEHRHFSAVTGIIQALEDTHADLLVLIARPRSFLGRLFHGSITAQVLRLSPVPVLLLPATAEVPLADFTDRATTVVEYANAVLTGLSPAS